MRYRRREAEATLRSLMGQFKVVLITGARQVGKTTMLQHVLPEGFGYVTLDDPRAGLLAREDPALFFDANRPKLATPNRCASQNSSLLKSTLTGAPRWSGRPFEMPQW